MPHITDKCGIRSRGCVVSLLVILLLALYYYMVNPRPLPSSPSYDDRERTQQSLEQPPQQPQPQPEPKQPTLQEWALAPPETEGVWCKPCSAADFRTDWYQYLVKKSQMDPDRLHRKFWEIIYLYYVIDEFIDCSKGARGLVFAAGNEPTVSYLASKGCRIVATDMDTDKVGSEWKDTNQFANSKKQLYSPINDLDETTFNKRVSYRPVDLNHIPTTDLTKGGSTEFDFVWSLCSIEHVGTISLGQRAILNSMELLKPGGIAFHTVEFTLSSSQETLETGNIVLWRKQDVEVLIRDLRTLGYKPFPITFHAGTDVVDQVPDVPPYKEHPHLKLLLANHIVTSFAIIVQK
eukprot:TRINITY_DN847_c0_g1_i4.p1 TRINITY_DN847_c0_g1~~TRINITY_DN847_c0_g1_i4.p1  ORF type:complete len:349 (+),score=61.99 TRINITY_DN847_c0_g1_i4:127-1173(+)